MKVSPDTIREDTGLQCVLDRLRTHVTSAHAVRRIDVLEYATSLEEVRRRLTFAEELQACLRFDDPIPFLPPEDTSGSLERSKPRGAALQSEEFMAILDLARTSRLCKFFFLSRREQYPAIGGTFSAVEIPVEVESTIESVYDVDGNIRDSASRELRQIRKNLNRARANLRSAIMKALTSAASAGFAADDQPTVRGGRMVIPIRSEAKRKVAGFVQDVSSSGQTIFIEPTECLDHNNLIRELETAEKREIELIRRLLTDTVRQNSAALQLAQDVLEEFEVRRAIAILANEMDAVVPIFNEDGALFICEGRNPELLLHFQQNDSGRQVVPLNLELGSTFTTLVISGPNAGGKSIALKSIGVFQLMLALGIPVPVDEKSSFPFFDSIFIDIGDTQSVTDDLSTYSSHLSRLKEMLLLAGEKSLILIDEAGAGTDPDEGMALFQSVLEQLSETGARTVLTTHHGALKIFAHEADGAANGSMIFDQETLSPTFRYQSGSPGSSYAQEMAKRVGLPDSVLTRAKELLGKGRADVTSFLSMLQQKTEKLEREESRALHAQKEAERLRETLSDRIFKLQAEREEILATAISQAEDVVKNANKTIERVVREIRETSAGKKETKEARKAVIDLRSSLERDRARLIRKGRRSESVSRQKTADEAASNRSASNRSASNRSVSKESSPGSDPITVGDRVRLDDGQATGDVIMLERGKAVVLFASAQVNVKTSRLIRVSGPSAQQVHIRQNRTDSGLPNITHARSRLDVRGMRVAEAILEVTSLVDQALAAGLLSVDILHGKGTGALRMAIQENMAARTDILKFEEAHPDQGGSGITRVWLSD